MSEKRCTHGRRAGEPEWVPHCNKPVTHAVLVSPNGLMPEGYLRETCEEHGRQLAEGEIYLGIARSVYFVRIEELEEVLAL